MMGRDTPSRGLDLTAQWIADEFRRFGLTPGGDDGTFLQRYVVQQVRLNVATSSVEIEGGPTWKFGSEVLKLSGGYSPDGTTGRAVIVSGALQNPEDLDNIDVAGAVVLVVADAAVSGQTQQLLFGLARRNAAAVVAVGPHQEAAWQQMAARQSRVTTSLASSNRPGRTPTFAVRDAVAELALGAHGVDLASVRREARGLKVTSVPNLMVTIRTQPEVVRELTAPNTVGILEGSDPELKNEYMVFSAHMDHVGTRRSPDADSIWNGADDDASGTVGIVELAEAFAMLTPRPKRSIIFLTVSGEEKGLWGSNYFTANPPVPIENMVANLNADMIGRNWTDTIVVIGKEHSDLGETLNRVGAEHPELNMTPTDDIWPAERFYFRSDHYNFARQGVPILFFFNGTHDDYHQPTDEVERIDEEKASRIVQMMFYLGLDVANAPERPKWNQESYQRIVSE
jgi:hypothetical protein